ncbi:hypothetical protein CRENBAI_006932 [Crenichthys baileyi]|uniref:Uncharacterized protein n=1 Tax=Crenichthys baileyi TaxID=28760 RepID=A0AAV9S5K1_9TELE
MQASLSKEVESLKELVLGICIEIFKYVLQIKTNVKLKKGFLNTDVKQDGFFCCLGTKEQTGQFIKLMGENDHLFTGAKISATVAWRYNNNISVQFQKLLSL